MNSRALFPTGGPKPLTGKVSKPFPDAAHLAGKEAGYEVRGRVLPLSFRRPSPCRRRCGKLFVVEVWLAIVHPACRTAAV